ncbi:MAG: hypothetical protein M3237_14570 [Actinomycetota bacterium]|nr:hypothetical protein [Actinomycetota bacterium]
MPRRYARRTACGDPKVRGDQDAQITEQILFADVPPDDLPAHEPATWAIGVVVAGNFAIALFGWLTIRRYTD